MGLLSVSIWLPILAGTVLLAIGRDENAHAVRWLALVAAIASFLITLPLISGFDVASASALLDRLMRGLGKTFWFPPFSQTFYGRPA